MVSWVAFCRTDCRRAREHTATSASSLGASFRLVDNVVNGTGRIAADGSAVLAYVYAIPSVGFDAGLAPPKFPSNEDVARFDRTGRLLWTQTLSSVLGIASGTAFAAADANSETTVTATIPADVSALQGVIAHLDANGNVAWALQATNANSGPLVALSDGSVVVQYQNAKDATQNYLVGIAKDGTPEWHFDASELIGVASTLIADGSGALGAFFGFDGNAHLVSTSKGAAHCDEWTIDASNCEKDPGGVTTCADLALGVAAGNQVYFTGGNFLGLADLGGMP
jgi:hypothetical protein